MRVASSTTPLRRTETDNLGTALGAAVEQDRSAHPACDGAVDGLADRGRQRDQHDLPALAAHAKDAVTVFLAQAADVGAGGS